MLNWTLIDSAHAVPESLRAGTSAASFPEDSFANAGPFQVQWKSLREGKACGMDFLVIDTGTISAAILPSRGMGIWKCWSGGNEFGWQSPVRGPVHPCLVPIGDPSGIGWLEGFDELLVRCGLRSNGAPEFNANGGVVYPVHGRIANLPAHHLRIEVDVENGILDVVGLVSESRFLVYALELESRIRFRADSNVIEISDRVTNVFSTPSSMQLLYHINLGQPVLQSGSKLYVPYSELAPRDDRASEGIGEWNVCEGPESGYGEQVYYASAISDNSHWSSAVLTNASEELGYCVSFDTRTLPYVNLWKNTAAVEDGYVVGMEPATGFPNTKSFEEKQGRVVRLQGGESRTFRLKLQPLLTANEVNVAKERIDQLQATKRGIVHPTPLPDWSPARSRDS